MLTIGNKAVVSDADAADGVKNASMVRFLWQKGDDPDGRSADFPQNAQRRACSPLYFLHRAYSFEIIGRFDFQIIGAEYIEDFLCFQLTAGLIARSRNNGAEFRVHRLGQVVAKGLLHNKGRASLPDWLLMRIMGSYSRPTSAGSIGR